MCAMVTLCLVFGFLLVGQAAAVRYYAVGTASTAGVWYFLGAGFCAHVNNQYSDIKMTAEITAGSGENYNLVKRGEIDFAMIHPNFGPDDIEKGAIQTGSDCPFRQFLWSSTTNDFHWFTRKNSPVRSLSDIKGKKVGIGPHGSGGTVKNIRVIKALTGYRLDEGYDGIYLAYPDMLRGIQDDTIDLASFFLAWPAPSVTNLAVLTPIRIISLSDQEINKVLEGDPALMLMERVIPKGTYRGQDQDVHTLGQVQGILCTPDIPEKDVYNIIKGLFTNVEERNMIHPQAKGWTIEATIEMGERQAAVGVPFHPGVKKYLMEIGKWSSKLEAK
jgi:hypothetical protein